MGYSTFPPLVMVMAGVGLSTPPARLNPNEGGKANGYVLAFPPSRLLASSRAVSFFRPTHIFGTALSEAD